MYDPDHVFRPSNFFTNLKSIPFDMKEKFVEIYEYYRNKFKLKLISL